MKRKPPREEPDCCFSCRSFSPVHGKKGFGYCMKHCGNRKPKDICEDYRRDYSMRLR